MKIGNLPLGNSLDGNSFSISINSGPCVDVAGPYPQVVVANSARGDQKGSYIRLVKMTKRTGRSVYQTRPEEKITDYELELEFDINLYKDEAGKQLWKKLTNGRMKCVLSFWE